jgi:hypothetical protein
LIVIINTGLFIGVKTISIVVALITINPIVTLTPLLGKTFNLSQGLIQSIIKETSKIVPAFVTVRNVTSIMKKAQNLFLAITNSNILNLIAHFVHRLIDDIIGITAKMVTLPGDIVATLKKTVPAIQARIKIDPDALIASSKKTISTIKGKMINAIDSITGRKKP